MKNRLFLLNLMLLALIGASAWRLRQNWLDARAREQQMFGRSYKPSPAPALPPFIAAPAVAAANYFDVAEKMLFSKDRNPVVVVEAPPVKPMPPLPFFHGLMDLGNGPTIILSEKSGAPHRGYHPGEKIGEFTIAAVSQDTVEFQWDGKPVRRRFDELVDRNPQAAAPPAAGQGTAAVPPPATAPAADSPKSAVISSTTKGGPGPGQAGEIRPCQADDTSPPGTVTDGYKKVVSRTPFGPVCRWEPLN